MKFIINAKIEGSSIIKNPFFGSHTEYVISITTHLSIWQIKKRFSDYEKLHKSIAGKIACLPPLPEKSIFNMNEKVVSKRKVLLEEYLNHLLSRYNIMTFPEIMDFIEMDKELFLLLSKSPSEIESKREKSRSLIKNKSHEFIKANSSENKMKSSFYKDLYQCELGNEEHIEKFLRKLEESEEETSQSVNAFWKALTRNWPSFDKEDVMKLFFGNGNDLKGLFYHCGRIKENYFGAESCLNLLYKLLQFDYNPDCEKFVACLRMSRLDNIKKIKLEEHLKCAKENVVQSCLKVLKEILNKERGYDLRTILSDEIAEKKFSDLTEFQMI